MGKMNIDDATGMPLHICDKCGCECLGWDDPEDRILCSKCENEETKMEDEINKLVEENDKLKTILESLLIAIPEYTGAMDDTCKKVQKQLDSMSK